MKGKRVKKPMAVMLTEIHQLKISHLTLVTGFTNEECGTLLNLLQKANIQKQPSVDTHEEQINQARVKQSHDAGSHYAFLNQSFKEYFSNPWTKNVQLLSVKVMRNKSNVS